MSDRYNERDYSSRRSNSQRQGGQSNARSSYSRSSQNYSSSTGRTRSTRETSRSGRSSSDRVSMNASDYMRSERADRANRTSRAERNRDTAGATGAQRQTRTSAASGSRTQRSSADRTSTTTNRFSRAAAENNVRTQRRSAAESASGSARSRAAGGQQRPTSRQRSTDADRALARQRTNSMQRRSSARAGEGGVRLGTPDQVSRPLQGLTPKRSGRGFGKLKIALIAVVVVILVGAGSAFAYINSINGNLHEGIDDNLRNSLVKTDLTNEPFYMVLLGTDASEQRDTEEDFGGSYRSDSNMLVRIDPVNKKVTLVSIHRDTEVDLGEYGTQKINSAYAYGGPALAVQAISNMAGVPISHYASINFDGFRDLVDALGGVEVDVPVTIDDEDAGGHLDAGLQTLNGEQALILCRSRNTYSDAADPDSMRAANQRLVLSAIAKKVLKSDVATIANSVSAMSKFVTTDLEVNDIIGLAQAMQGLDPENDIYTAMDPVTNTYSTEDLGWHTTLNVDEWQTMMARIDEGLPPLEGNVVDEATGTVIATAGADAEDATVKTNWIAVQNGTTTAGLAFQAAELLQANNFINAIADSTDPGGFEETLIIPYSSSLSYEAQQIQKVLGCGKIIEDDGTYPFSGSFLVIIGADFKAPDTSSTSSSSSSSSAS